MKSSNAFPLIRLTAALAAGLALGAYSRSDGKAPVVVLGKANSPPVLSPVVVRPSGGSDPASNSDQAAEVLSPVVVSAPAPSIATSSPQPEVTASRTAAPVAATSTRADRPSTAAVDVEPPRPAPTKRASPIAEPALPRRATVAAANAPRAALPDAYESGAQPEQARSLNARAIALINAGRPEQAIAPLERAVAMQPNDAEMLGNLGYAYMLVGDNGRASSRLRRALDISPTRSATWLNLGQTYAELGQRETAVDAVLTGYRHSSRKGSVRAALQAASTGRRYSASWREAASLALARIDGS
jgi:tetratricopeptide (TPR) repeat protein